MDTDFDNDALPSRQMKKNWNSKNRRTVSFSNRQDPNKFSADMPSPITISDLLEIARRDGPVKLARFDRDLGRMVEDTITGDMPIDEIVL
jgi:hypothetical protein